MFQDLLQKVGAEDVLAFGLGGLTVVGVLILLSIYIVATNWRKVRQHQLDVALKQDMLDRGMSAADIERIMGSKSEAVEGTVTSHPAAGEVVIEWEGDWYPGILLKTDGSKYYVHYKGYDEEEWVTVDRIRFPAQPQSVSAAEPQHVPA